jgi:ribonucleoside-diphosphate reductase alpha chain
MPVIVKAMDDVLEESIKRHALPEQREMARKFRNIGIGVMGLADALIKLGMTYGSDEAVKFSKELQAFIFKAVLQASVNLGLDRGSFPGYTREVWESDIIKNNIDTKTIEYYKKTNRLRNCSLLSVAPTGSIGTMIGVSTGVEPNFALEFNRMTKSLNGEDQMYKVQAGIVKEYRAIHGDGELPKYFVTAQSIQHVDKINMQAALQDATDTAISTTTNLPKGTTLETVKELYILSWKAGLKGQTIYVDGSRDPILSVDKEEEKQEEQTNITLKRGEIEPPSDSYIGFKRTIMTGCGTLHVNVYVDKDSKQLKEIYLSKGSTGGCALFMNGLSRMISLAARGGVSTEAILDQLKSCGTCPSYAVRRATKKDTSPGACCPSAIANAIKDIMAQANEEEIIVKKPTVNLTYLKDEPVLGICPECKTKGIVAQGGCSQCQNCGYSRCS